jgi:hypothetical protein
MYSIYQIWDKVSCGGSRQILLRLEPPIATISAEYGVESGRALRAVCEEVGNLFRDSSP